MLTYGPYIFTVLNAAPCIENYDTRALEEFIYCAYFDQVVDLKGRRPGNMYTLLE